MFAHLPARPFSHWHAFMRQREAGFVRETVMFALAVWRQVLFSANGQGAEWESIAGVMFGRPQHESNVRPLP